MKLMQAMSLIVMAGMILSMSVWVYGQDKSADPNQLAAAAKFDPEQLLEIAPRAVSCGVVVRVNDDAITSEEVLQGINDKLAESIKDIKRDENGALDLTDFIGRVITQVRDETMAKMYNLLIYQYARKDLSKTKGLDEALEAMRAEKRKEIIMQNGGSEAKARQKLAEQGSTIDDEMKLIERQMVISGFRDKHFAPAIKITRSQMLQYYRANMKDKYSQAASMQFQLIEIVKEKTPDAAEKATAARAELEGGADFAAVYDKYSNGYQAGEGGLWRPLHPDSVRENYKPVVEALKQTPQGKLTAVVETETACFIGKLISNADAYVKPFSGVQAEIVKAIRESRWDKYSGELSRTLMDEAVLGDLDEFIKSTILLAYNQCNRLAPVAAVE